MASWNSADADNDGRWPDGHEVMVRFPLTQWEPPDGIADDEAQRLMTADREDWPWLHGEIASQCGPDEWEVMVVDDRLATLEDGSPATADTPPDDLRYPVCFRDGAEIREAEHASEAAADALAPQALATPGEAPESDTKQGNTRDRRESREAIAGLDEPQSGAAKAYAAEHPVLCAHANQDVAGAHLLQPGEKCSGTWPRGGGARPADSDPVHEREAEAG